MKRRRIKQNIWGNWFKASAPAEVRAERGPGGFKALVKAAYKASKGGAQ